MYSIFSTEPLLSMYSALYMFSIFCRCCGYMSKINKRCLIIPLISYRARNPALWDVFLSSSRTNQQQRCLFIS